MSEEDQSQIDGDSGGGDTRAFSPSESSAMRQVGAQMGEFRLLRRLGKGGMAEVWLSEQTTLKRNVALKLLRSELMEDETYVKRFQTEAKAAAGLNHPNIVQVYTVGCERGQHFIAQEYVHGQTLKALLQKRGPLDLSLALMIIRQAAAALQAAGERGIVHRDIKPENIMLTRKGEVKVADFGLAQLQGGERLHLTQEGVTMGTPLYMSPEQVSGHAIDQRSDIYSLGVTCYHMFAGVPPFQGDNAVSVAVKHLHENPLPLAEIRPDLPAPVCQMVQRMMAKKPENRYQDAQSIVTDVRKLAKSLRTGEPVDELTAGGDSAAPQFPIRRPALVLTLLCLVVFSLTAGMGWSLRPRISQVAAGAVDSVPRFATAKDQYLYAMFKVDDEDAFKAVIRRFPGADDQMYTRRAQEQLALLYLKDRRRKEDAVTQLETLKSRVDPRNSQLKAEANIGEAYLNAINDNKEVARRIMEREAENFDKLLTGSWRQLYDDVRQLTNQAEASN